MNALRRYFSFLVIFALVQVFTACSGDSSRLTGRLSSDPTGCVDDEDEPGDVDADDDDDDAGDCEDDD